MDTGRMMLIADTNVLQHAAFETEANGEGGEDE